MNVTRENVKEVTGFVSTIGGASMTGAACARYVAIMPNPAMRIAAWVATCGLGAVVGNVAKKGTDELIDSWADLIDRIKNR